MGVAHALKTIAHGLGSYKEGRCELLNSALWLDGKSIPKRPLTGHGRRQAQQLAADRVGQRQAGRMQPQALYPQQDGYSTVQWAFAMGGVADDRVGNVLEVSTQLVAPTGVG